MDRSGEGKQKSKLVGMEFEKGKNCDEHLLYKESKEKRDKAGH